MNEHLDRRSSDDQSQLDEIRRATGKLYRLVQGIPTDDPEIAREVLPILAAWLERDPPPANRGSIYTRFANENAQPYFELLLRLLPGELDETYELRFLTGAVVESAGDADVAKAWEAIRQRRNNPDWWRVVSFLAKRPTAPSSLIEEVVNSLNSGALHPSEIEYMARIRHRKIVEWFRERQDSKDPALAKLARKVAGKTPAPPDGVTLVGDEPSREGEVESCEADIEDMPSILREYGKIWALQMPRWLSTKKALDFLPVDKWARVDLKSKPGVPYSLWIRLEDVDVVELVLMRET